MPINVLKGQSVSIWCTNGCLKIEKAVFLCSASEDKVKKHEEQDTALARSYCGDGKPGDNVQMCTLKACYPFWNRTKADCTDSITPSLSITYRL